MKYINRLSIRAKFLSISMLPIIFSVFLAFYIIKEVNDKSNSIEKVSKLTDFGINVSNLIHNLQLERGRSNAYLNSKEETISNDLIVQKENTDKSINKLKENIISSDIKDISQTINIKIQKYEDAIEKINKIRIDVSSKAISSKKLVEIYSEFISVLTAVYESISEFSIESRELNVQFVNSINLIKLKENNGILRAVLSGVFSAHKFDKNSYKVFIESLKSTSIYEKNLKENADVNILEIYNNEISSGIEEITNKYINYALEMRDDSLNLYSSTEVFQAFTNKINKLRNVELKFSENILKITSKELKEISFKKYLILISFALFITLTIYIVLKISNDISSRLKVATKIAEEIAKGNINSIKDILN